VVGVFFSERSGEGEALENIERSKIIFYLPYTEYDRLAELLTSKVIVGSKG